MPDNVGSSHTANLEERLVAELKRALQETHFYQQGYMAEREAFIVQKQQSMLAAFQRVQGKGS